MTKVFDTHLPPVNCEFEKTCLAMLRILVSSSSRRSLSKRCAEHRLLSSSAKATSVNTMFETDFGDSEPKRSPPVVPHAISPRRQVPPHIARPSYSETGYLPMSIFPDSVLIHDEDSVHRMRQAARLARKILDYACSLAQVGVTTDDIDEKVHNAIIENEAYPSPLNYAGFPKSVCSSVNEVICHGIPDARPLEFGDVVSFDVSCYLNGVHGDNCATVIVGDSQEQADDSVGVDWRGVPYKTQFDDPDDIPRFMAARRLVHATRESLYAGISTCGPGSCLSDIGGAIHDVADAYGYDTVKKYRGHGIADVFHCPPFVKVKRENCFCSALQRDTPPNTVCVVHSTFATMTDCNSSPV